MLLPLERLNRQLHEEVERVGGGFLKTDATGFEASCQLFVHEGSELKADSQGSVHWHPWHQESCSKRALLAVLKRWPTFAGPPLDHRVGIWYKHFCLQRHRTSGAYRWRELGIKESGYPDILPWHELDRLYTGLSLHTGSKTAKA